MNEKNNKYHSLTENLISTSQQHNCCYYLFCCWLCKKETFVIYNLYN